VVEEDVDGNGALDEADAPVIYLWSDREPGIRRLGPAHARILDHAVDGAAHALLLRLRVDTNGDKQIDDQDGVQLWRVDLLANDRGSELVIPHIPPAKP
jgi:hypothetical protein